MFNDKQYTRFSESTDVITAEDILIARCSISEIDIRDLMHYPSRLGEIMFILCFEGEITFMSGNMEIKLRKGEGFYNFHSDIYQYIAQDNARVYIWSCSKSFVSKFTIDNALKNHILQGLIFSPTFRFPLELQQECDRCFEIIRTERHNIKGRYSDECIRSLVHYLLYHMLNFISDRENRLKQSEEHGNVPGVHFNNFIVLLNDNLKKERNLSFYAQKMSITPAYLSSVVKRFSGKNGHCFITDTVILEIKNMLKHSDLSIKEITYELNFPNPSFLTRFFRKNTGMTPLEYRKKK